MNEKDFAELAAGAALHALSPADERLFHDALAAHPEWADLVDDDVETVASLEAVAAPEFPPLDLRATLLAQIASTPQHGDDDSVAHPTESSGFSDAPSAAATGRSAESKPRAAVPRRWTRTIFALAACLALVVGVGFGAAALGGYLNRPAAVVALEQIQSADDAQQATVTLDDGGTATAHWSASAGAAVLVTDGIPAAAKGESYELWFVRGETPISAGVFDVEGGTATAALSGDMHAGDVIAVTVEQEGGSPTGKPTSDPFIVIPTA